jgi:hypothetical protein
VRSTTPEPAHLRATFESNPDLRAAWHDAHAYREHGRPLLLAPPRRPRRARAHRRQPGSRRLRLTRPRYERNGHRVTETRSNGCRESGKCRSRELSAHRIAGISRGTARRARTRCLATVHADHHHFVIPSEGRCVARRGTCSSFSKRKPTADSSLRSE